MQLGAVTVDLDGLAEYHRIHSLHTPETDVILTQAVPRLLDWATGLGLRLTLFCVGRTLEDPAVRRLVLQAHNAGHEIANHSHAHHYRMCLFPPAAMTADLLEAADAIAAVTGVAPVGFRAPGYNLSADLLAAVVETGHQYDSSIFPSLAYYGARAGAVATYAVQGQPSASLPGDWRQFAGPRRPYRPSQKHPHKPGKPALPLWELPMGVALPMGLPLIGTFVPLYPPGVRKALGWLRTVGGGPFNVELHAIDFSDPNDGFHPYLLDRQPGLTQPLAERITALTDLARQMKKRLNVCPLREWLPQL